MTNSGMMRRLVPNLHRRGQGERGWAVSYLLRKEPTRFPHWLYAWMVGPVNRLLCWRYGHTNLLRQLWLVYGMAEPLCSYCTKDIRRPEDVPGTQELPTKANAG